MVREIPLTRGLVALVDDTDYEQVIAAGPWFPRPQPHTVYCQRNMRRAAAHTTQSLHVFLTGMTGADHRNGNGLDNQRSNLRAATAAQNAMNRRIRSDNRSGFKGVTWDRQRHHWKALIYSGGRARHIGYYDIPEDAALAYDAAAIELFGEFARPNFPLELTP
jgi:hypothetical protein